MKKQETPTPDLNDLTPECVELVRGFPTIREPQIQLLAQFLDVKANIDDSNDVLRTKAGIQYVLDTLDNIALLQQSTSFQKSNNSVTIDMEMELN